MRYIITIHPAYDDPFCFVMDIRGNWNSTLLSELTQARLPRTTQYFFTKESAESMVSKLGSKVREPHGEVRMREVPRDETVKHWALSEIQEDLNRTWTLESYSAEFKDMKLPYRDFDHSLKHVMKATGKLVAIVEEADHGHESSFSTQKVANYLADLVICAIRMASKHPYGEIDIEKAVMDRIREKSDTPVEK
jgi:hypothetical protein